MPSVKINQPLYERSKLSAKEAGYSSVEEFIEHAIEKELQRIESPAPPDLIAQRLKGLGYLD